MDNSKLEIPEAQKNDRILTADRKKAKADEMKNIFNQTIIKHQRKISGADQRLKDLIKELPPLLAKNACAGVSDEEVASHRKQIASLQQMVDDGPLVIGELRKQYGQQAHQADKANVIMVQFAKFKEAKKVVAKSAYSGAVECIKARQKLDVLAPVLGLEQDILSFFKWLRVVKPASFWAPDDRRGLEEAGKR